MVAGAAVIAFYGQQIARDAWPQVKSRSSVPPPASISAPEPTTTTAMNPKDNIPNIGPNSVVSVNQQGGITAGSVNIHAGPKPWGFGRDGLEKLTARMKMLPPPKPIAGHDILTAAMGDPDSMRFAGDLVFALRAAGWDLPGSGMSQAVFSGPVEGVVFVVPSKDITTTMNAFFQLLNQEGIPSHAELDATLPAGTFRIVIGSRPR